MCWMEMDGKRSNDCKSIFKKMKKGTAAAVPFYLCTVKTINSFAPPAASEVQNKLLKLLTKPLPMNRKQTKIPITIEDVGFIYHNQLENFYVHTSQCFCAHCRKGATSTISHYTIFLNNLFDIELHGFCRSCAYKMNRYIETGEYPGMTQNAEAVWKTHKALHELKIKKEK